MKRRTLILAAAGAAALAQGAPALAAVEANPKFLVTTNMGSFEIQLTPKRAPETCANFERYVKEGFFDKTVFHRVIAGFMIQGGGFTADLHQKPTHAPVKNEARGGLWNDKYTIAMARTSDPHSATSQFFINVADNHFLDQRNSRDGWGYTVFGRVTKGTDVVEKISNVATKTDFATGMGDVPVKPVVIESVRPVD